MKLRVIIASHNRRETTLTALSALFAACAAAEICAEVTLFDDGSKDGTTDAVLAAFPEVTVLQGDGSAFWAQSMYRAERHVLQAIAGSEDVDQADYIVWLNDDVVLDIDAVERVAHLVAARPNAIIACATRDPDSHDVTYAGFQRRGHHPLRLAPVMPTSAFVPIDSFNGNFIMVPTSVARALESIDGNYSHALADIDYGFRAHQKSIEVLLAPGTYGTCPRNAPFTDQNTASAWRRFVGPKGGGNPRSLMRILRLGAPRSWPFYLGATYALWWLRAIKDNVLGRLPH